MKERSRLQSAMTDQAPEANRQVLDGKAVRPEAPTSRLKCKVAVPHELRLAC